MGLAAATCPNCDGVLQIAENLTGTFTCPYCGCTVTSQDTEEFSVEGGVLVAYHGKATDVAIPDDIVVIGTNAFADTAVKNVTVPSSVKEIRKSAFANCRYLEHVSLSEGLEELDLDAFSNCTSLGKLVIPSSVCVMKGKGDRLSLALVDTNVSTSSILDAQAIEIVIDAENARYLAEHLLIKTAPWAAIPPKPSHWSVKPLGYWSVRHIVVPGVLDFEGEDCGAKFIDAMFSQEEQDAFRRGYWRGAGRCEKCGGTYRRVRRKLPLGKYWTIWRCRGCGHMLLEDPVLGYRSSSVNDVL